MLAEPPEETPHEGDLAMTDHHDMTLLRKWRAGDLQAGDVLIRRHYAYALGLAERRLSNRDDAVEATQNAMAVLVHKRDVIEEDFRKYLGKVVYFSVLTQTKRRPHEPLQDDAAAPVPPRGASTMLAEKEEEKLLVKALRSVSIDDQLVFYYKLATEEDPLAKKQKRAEIAALLELTPAQIDRRFDHAKKRVRKKLESFRDSPVRQSTLGGFDTWLASMHGKLPDGK